MAHKEWVANVDGHQVRVVNSWTGGTRLYIDGERRDSNHGLFAPDWTHWLSARVVPNDLNSALVEVYIKALFTVKVKIHVNGQQFSGDTI